MAAFSGNCRRRFVAMAREGAEAWSLLSVLLRFPSLGTTRQPIVPALQQRNRRMGLHRTMAGAGAAGLILAAFGFVTPSQAQQAVKFSLDWKFEGPAAPFTEALDKGYYKAEGLERDHRHRGRLAGADQPRGVRHLRHGLRRHQFADQVPRRQSGHADQGGVRALQPAAVRDHRRARAAASPSRRIWRARSSARPPPTAPTRSGRSSCRRTASTPPRSRSKTSASRCASRCWPRARSTPSPVSRSPPTSTSRTAACRSTTSSCC